HDCELVPYYVGIVSEEDGCKTWVPDVDASKKPSVGITYHSLEQAYEYYKAYAKKAGFEVRLAQQYRYKNKDKSIKEKNLDIMYFVVV
nr:FAR1 DNA binding domain, zinc finger, SWIM-type, MULE transposase domain, FHY3/FAR1 family [Tanacetum cinerariifolium]